MKTLKSEMTPARHTALFLFPLYTEYWNTFCGLPWSTLELGIDYRLAAQQSRERARYYTRHPGITAAAAAAVVAAMAVYTAAVAPTAAATTESP